MRFTKLWTAAALLTGLVALGCGGGGGGGGGSASGVPELQARIVVSLGNDVILPGTQEAETAIQALEAAVATLVGNVTAPNLSAATDAWAEARRVWNRVEASLFGPPEDLLLQAFVDSSPIDEAAIETILADTSGVPTIDTAFLNTQGVTRRGFLVIEYFLFDPGGEAAVLTALGSASDAARRREYLQAATADTALTIGRIANTWRASGDNYVGAFTTAPAGNATYGNAQLAIDDVVNLMILHATELGDKRLGRPLGKTSGGAPQPPGAETERSGNSLQDATNDYIALRRLYFGEYEGASAAGLDELVALFSPAVEARIRAAMLDLEAALAAIPAPLVTAAQINTPLVEDAFQKARLLKDIFVVDLAGTLGVTIGFNPDDGD